MHYAVSPAGHTNRCFHYCCCGRCFRCRRCRRSRRCEFVFIQLCRSAESDLCRSRSRSLCIDWSLCARAILVVIAVVFDFSLLFFYIFIAFRAGPAPSACFRVWVLPKFSECVFARACVCECCNADNKRNLPVSTFPVASPALLYPMPLFALPK